MNTIFDGFAQLSDDEIKGQIALLRCITLSNTIKEQGQRAIGIIVDAAGGFFGRVKGEETAEEKIADANVRRMVDRVYNELHEYGRQELNDILKQELIYKYQALSGGGADKTEDMTNDCLHILLLREGARAYGIDENRTLGYLCDEIHARYYDQYIKVLYKSIRRMTADELGDIEYNIQKAIVKSDINRMRQLAGELMLREFNGKSIVKKILYSNDSKPLKKIVDAMGLSIFDGVDIVIRTVYDSMISLCRVERSMIAQSIWMGHNGFGRKMEVCADLMPSFDESIRGEESEKERRILILRASEDNLNKKLKEDLTIIDKYNRENVSIESAVEHDEQRLSEAGEQYEGLLSQKEELTAEGEKTKKAYDDYVRDNPLKSNSNPEYKKLKLEYEGIARSIRNNDMRLASIEKTIEKLKKDISGNRERIALLDEELKNKRNILVEDVTEYNRLITELENEAVYLSQVLSKKWKRFFVTLEFERGVYEQVIKNFTCREIVGIEQLLTELMECDSREIMKNRDGVICCMVATGKYAQLFYENGKIIQINVRDRNR